MSIIEDLNWRYATKEFDPSKRVSPKDLETLLDALVLSPSSFGLQPWKFVVVENQELKEQLLANSWNQKQVVQASHVLVLCRPLTFGAEDVINFVRSTAEIRAQEAETLSGYQKVMTDFLGRMNDAQIAEWMKNQIYIALGNLMTVAATMRIDACPMEGFVSTEYDKVLGLTEKGLASVVVCPVGYRAASDKYGDLSKVRYEKENLVIRL
jgi:nitroreductase